jgi:hypothetical protein
MREHLLPLVVVVATSAVACSRLPGLGGRVEDAGTDAAPLATGVVADAGAATRPDAGAVIGVVGLPPLAPLGAKETLGCLATTPSARARVVFTGDTTARLEIDGPEKRRINAKTAPYAATTQLTFAGYAPGDVRPPAEKLAVGKSSLGRLVMMGDHEELFLGGDVAFGPLSTSNGIPCAK